MASATSAVVLAGGGSRRFGTDKRRHRVDGIPLLRRVVDAAVAVTDEVVVSVSRDHPLPEDIELPPGVEVVQDRIGDVGPLAGLAAGLHAVRGELVLVVAADHPWLDPRTLTALIDRVATSRDTDVAVLTVEGRRQPLVAAYRREVHGTVRRLLDVGERRALALLDHLAVAEVTAAPGATRSARDVDVPTDLGAEHARQLGHVRVLAVSPDGAAEVDDATAGEEPLRIRIAGPGQEPLDVTTTMRTPGHEGELAVGFLHAEGLVRPGEVVATTAGDLVDDARPDDTVTVHVRHRVDADRLVHRHVPATASCGVCGRASIEDLLARTSPLDPRSGPRVDWRVLAALPARLRDRQRTFDVTGGLHATAIAAVTGDLLTVREDIGRHNALDAAIGAHVLAETLPLHDRVVVLSGRVGFELVQKAAVAGAPIIVAVGAPSDLAVRTADALGITLVGFVREGRGNVYTHPERVLPPRS